MLLGLGAGLALRGVVPEWSPLLRGAVLATSSTAVYFSVTLALGLPDATEVLGQISRRLRIEGEGGRIEHSELTYGDGLIMVGEAGGKASRPVPLPCVSPRAVGDRLTQALCVCVDDADAHCARARAAGAIIAEEPTTHDYGDDYWSDRSYRARK